MQNELQFCDLFKHTFYVNEIYTTKSLYFEGIFVCLVDMLCSDISLSLFELVGATAPSELLIGSVWIGSDMSPRLRCSFEIRDSLGPSAMY